MEIASRKRDPFHYAKMERESNLFPFFCWDFVNNLDSFYRGYYRFFIFFSNSSGDKYPIEE